MYAESFEFNGIDSKDVDILIMNFDGFNNDGTASVGDEISFLTTQSATSDRKNYHGYTRENGLTVTFQIGKNPCNSNDFEFTREELAFIKAWLERKDGYKFLRFFQKGYEKTYFYCQNHVEWIRVQGKIVGAEVSVTCNAPYGYSEVQTIDKQLNDGESFIIYNDSDEQGSLEIDQIEIGINQTAGNNCTITIDNSLETYYSLNRQYKCIINNCNPGEHIIIDGRNHIITTEENYQVKHTDGNISSDFNFHYPRLINISTNLPLINYIPSNNNYPTYDQNRINKFTVTGADCNVTFAYRTIRSVMP
ncbi:MAG: hypothetical protein J1E62_05455 [Lachnospiraceae bacterium]|nr:hypothetical protein [Lachnospiraceae bacterium]